jgi:hypothetical protein
MSSKILVSTAALYNYLTNVLEFNMPEMKVKVADGELQINGFRYLMVDHKGTFETEVSVEKLRRLRKVLSTVTDQPITLLIEYDQFEIRSILI